MAAVAVDDRHAQHVAEAVLSDWEQERPRAGAPIGRSALHPGRPWSFAALVETIGAYLPPGMIAARLGVNDRRVYRWRDRCLTDVQADELATRLGLHPAQVWPDW